LLCLPASQRPAGFIGATCGCIEDYALCAGSADDLSGENKDTPSNYIVPARPSDDSDPPKDVAAVEVGTELSLMAASNMQTFIGKHCAQ
jgi:hypothetical protein